MQSLLLEAVTARGKDCQSSLSANLSPIAVGNFRDRMPFGWNNHDGVVWLHTHTHKVSMPVQSRRRKKHNQKVRRGKKVASRSIISNRIFCDCHAPFQQNSGLEHGQRGTCSHTHTCPGGSHTHTRLGKYLAVNTTKLTKAAAVPAHNARRQQEESRGGGRAGYTVEGAYTANKDTTSTPTCFTEAAVAKW